MSNGKKQQPTNQPPYLDESLVINTRLQEIERRQNEEKAEEKEYKRRQLIFNRWMVIFTGLLFLTSGVSDFILLRQTKASRDSADAADRAAKDADIGLEQASDGLRIDQRPYMIGDLGNWVKGSEPAPNGRVRINVDFKNIGKTPALTARTYLCMVVVVGPLTPDQVTDSVNRQVASMMRRLETVKSGEDIPPQGPVFVSVPLTNDSCPKPDDERNMTPEEYADFKHGRNRLRLTGVVRYSDSFGISPRVATMKLTPNLPPYETHICYLINGVAGEARSGLCGGENQIR